MSIRQLIEDLIAAPLAGAEVLQQLRPPSTDDMPQVLIESSMSHRVTTAVNPELANKKSASAIGATFSLFEIRDFIR